MKLTDEARYYKGKWRRVYYEKGYGHFYIINKKRHKSNMSYKRNLHNTKGISHGTKMSTLWKRGRK